MNIAFISGPEIFVVLLVFLLLFGANKIPELAKGIGKGMREFKKATDEIKEEINNNTGEVLDDINEVRKFRKKLDD
jgi:sec-independent protein translocase protein TatA